MDEGDEITANYVDRLTVELQGYDITSVQWMLYHIIFGLFPKWLKFDHPLICFDINLKLYIFFNNLAILSIELFWQL